MFGPESMLRTWQMTMNVHECTRNICVSMNTPTTYSTDDMQIFTMSICVSVKQPKLGLQLQRALHEARQMTTATPTEDKAYGKVSMTTGAALDGKMLPPL